MKFETSYIETVLINMVKYENFDVHLVANIQAHLYNLRDLNFILNFKTANQLLLKLDNTGLGIYIGNYYDRINRENIDMYILEHAGPARWRMMVHYSGPCWAIFFK